MMLMFRLVAWDFGGFLDEVASIRDVAEFEAVDFLKPMQLSVVESWANRYDLDRLTLETFTWENDERGELLSVVLFEGFGAGRRKSSPCILIDKQTIDLLEWLKWCAVYEVTAQDAYNSRCYDPTTKQYLSAPISPP